MTSTSTSSLCCPFLSRRQRERSSRTVIRASRAPVIAFLVARKGIALADAYDYVCSMRPVTSLNFHFLNQLAKLELAMGEGCSVLYHKDWQFFEFNNIS